jgi:hypothetical protein
MFFNIQHDIGTEISGYIVPDGVNGSVDLVLRANDQDVLDFTANITIESLVHAGRHSTGECGFLISNEHFTDLEFAGLETVFELEIRKRDDNMLIYRRPSYSFIQKKILRLETQMLPLWRFDKYFEPKFQYSMNNIENYGRETTTQFFLLNGILSEYLSGRILVRNYAHYIEDNYECITLLQDPYEELAERLFVFHQLKTTHFQHLGSREIANFRPAIHFVENMRLTDEKSVKAAFKTISDDVASILSDPLVRQLTTTTPGEAINRNGTASALSALSSFALVGLRSESEQFLAASAELIGVNYSELPPVPIFSQVTQLADILRTSKQAGYLLEKDRELYFSVKSAFEHAL